MHDELDRFFGDHKTTASLRSKYHAIVRHYADGVFDICCDHILAACWADLLTTPIDSFLGDVYMIAHQRLGFLPDSTRIIVSTMRDDDWLGKYAQPTGIEEALQRSTRRRHHGSIVAQNVGSILELTQEVRPAVLEIFPHIRSHMQTVMIQMGIETGIRLDWQEKLPALKEARRRSHIERP